MRCKVDEADSAALRFNVPVVVFEGVIKSLVLDAGADGFMARNPSSRCCFFNFNDYKISLKLKFCFAKDQTVG